MNLITVIIPNYNGLRFLEPCIDALRRQSLRDFDVLIVDNGSSDGSPDYIRRLERESCSVPGSCPDAGRPSCADEGCPSCADEGRPSCTDMDRSSCADEGRSSCPEEGRSSCPDIHAPLKVRGLYFDENKGFAPAVNAGIKASISPYVVLLNNDTAADPLYLETLLQAMENDCSGRLFAVTPRMVSMKDPSVLDDAGDGYTVLGWAFQRGVGQNASGQRFMKSCPVFSACAGAAMYRRSLLEELRLSEGQYFADNHFAYLEDVDLSFRAQNAGLDIRYVPSSLVLHAGSATSGSRYNAFKVRLSSRNNVFVNLRNMPLLFLLVNLPFLMAGHLVKLLFFIRRGFGKAYASGFLEGFRSLPSVLRQRCTALYGSFRKNPWQTLCGCIRSELCLISGTLSYLYDLLLRKVF